MNDLIKLILGQVPKYLTDFINVLASPREFVRQHDLFKKKELSEALVFGGISLVLALVIKIPVLPKDTSVFSYIAADGVWKMVIILIEAAIIRFAWHLVGGKAEFQQYLKANCYFFGIFSVISHLILLAGYHLNKSSLGNYSNEIILLYNVVMLGALGIWCLFAWRAYQELNSTRELQSKGAWLRGFGALLITGILSLPAIIFGALVRDALVGKVYGTIF